MSKAKEDLLPIHSTDKSCITGFIPDDGDKCCKNPHNWKGKGKYIPLLTLEECEQRKHDGMLDIYCTPDPYLYLGYKKYRDVVCSCGKVINATEYRM